MSNDIIPDNPLISVIIPVYGAEAYLPECISSVLNQTYKNLEIILVNDGSPDNSPRICDDFASADKRVKVIHKPNGGVSDALNAGLDLASGTYISIAGNDDRFAPDMIEFLYNSLIAHNVDISCCTFFTCYVGENIYVTDKHLSTEPLILTNNEASVKCLKGEIPFHTYAKLYSTRIFSVPPPPLRYPIEVRCEDVWAIMHTLMRANRGIYYSPLPKYYYRVRKGNYNNTHSSLQKRKLVYDAMELRRQYVENEYPSIAQAHEAASLRKYLAGAHSTASRSSFSNDADKQELISMITDLINQPDRLPLNTVPITIIEKFEVTLLKRFKIFFLLYSNIRKKFKEAGKILSRITKCNKAKQNTQSKEYILFP